MTEKQLEDNFREAYSRLFWMSKDITGDAEASRDILQECYTTLWHSHRDLPASDISAYLFTSVRNASLRRVRDQQRHATIPLDRLSDDGVFASEGNWRERELKVRSVEQLIRRLPPKAREMISLRFRQSLSYQDIATQTDTNIETVRKTLYRAMKSIRKQINANNIQNASTFDDDPTSFNI